MASLDPLDRELFQRAIDAAYSGVKVDELDSDEKLEAALRCELLSIALLNEMSVVWRKQGYDLSLGIGIAQGYATIGAIGFEGRLDYGAVGAVINLAARLCGEAKGAQILTNRKTLSKFEQLVEAEPIGELSLKGFAEADVWLRAELVRFVSTADIAIVLR